MFWPRNKGDKQLIWPRACPDHFPVYMVCGGSKAISNESGKSNESGHAGEIIKVYIIYCTLAITSFHDHDYSYSYHFLLKSCYHWSSLHCSRLQFWLTISHQINQGPFPLEFCSQDQNQFHLWPCTAIITEILVPGSIIFTTPMQSAELTQKLLKSQNYEISWSIAFAGFLKFV